MSQPYRVEVKVELRLILIFDFYLILGSFFTFLGPNGLFLGFG